MRPTLTQVFALSLLGLLLSLGLLFYLVFNGSEKTILKSSERLRASASHEVINRVTDYLKEAPMAVEHFEKEIRYGLVDPRNADSIQASLLSLLLANGNISEASFTYADSTGFDKDDYIELDRSTIGQVSVFQSEGRFSSRRTNFAGNQFVSKTTSLGDAAGEPSQVSKETPAMDPTEHATFQSPAKKDAEDDLLWTDLSWSQLDEALPQNRRRVELSVQKTVKNIHSQFAGVLRIGLMKEQIDRAVHLDITGQNESEPNPYLIFLCDNKGQLVTGFGQNDHIAVIGDDLRVVGDVPPPVATALRQPALKTIDKNQTIAGSFSVGQDTYLFTFRRWPDLETQDWIVGIVVPRDYYLHELLKSRRQILWASLALISVIILVGSLILHSVARAHSLVVRETSRMNAFEFSPSKNSSGLRDIGEVLAGLEKAKTAMRAMGKYVPVDLVRQLYHGGVEPVLGGESIDLSVLFSDIKEFTPFAEQTDPDRLAEILGRYLQMMATVIQNEKGTIDKYIGDSVMTFWNAPEAVADHALFACSAALKCRAALDNLYNLPEWRDTPRFETRFGLHRCTASVGHFGAPDRFNYTAIGDGINLASRLEGLNKYYGTSIIASESIHAAARERFEFRLLDRVAVKGKMQGITIYELLGESTQGKYRSPAVTRYEQAFEAYQRTDFKAALVLLADNSGDPPSLVLAARCRDFIENTPPASWNGIHVFESK